jgi:UDP-glucose:(heptosyl)LPS alpha-1,3-glucosyltransferase
MKIALTFPGCHRRGGVERVVYECARFLATKGHRVTVFAREFEQIGHGSVRFERVEVAARPTFLVGPRYFLQCEQMIQRQDFDVVNTHGSICPRDGVHWVHSVHAAWLERSRQFRPPWSAARWKQRLNPINQILLKLEAEHFAKRRYRKITATTPEVRQDLERIYGVPAGDVVIVPNGFAPEEFNPARRARLRDAMRTRLGIKPDEVVLLLVANELERKGYRTILSALRILDSQRLRLIVVGRPPEHVVRRHAVAIGLEDRVLACGPTDEVVSFHAAADIFVLPTQYEAFCLAILEALGSGLPVVTSNVPGARDAIQPGINGLLVSNPQSAEELAEALRKLLDEDTRSAYSQRAPGTVAHHQWPVILERYEEVLRQNCIANAA